VRLTGVLGGAAAGAALVLAGWGTGLVDAPERLSRGIAAFTAVFPHPVASADVDRIPCPPLRRTRLYVVCTPGCDEVWKVMAVRGLAAATLASLNRLPPEPLEDRRARVAAVVAREKLRLDREAAREMIGCYLRLEGLRPDLVLTQGALRRLREVRGDEEAMRLLAQSLEDPGALDRIAVETDAGGFVARFSYWQTYEPGRPVLDMEIRLGGDGLLRALLAGAAAGPEAAGAPPG
jgi:hypothetical protein